jgi:hypothetical protein
MGSLASDAWKACAVPEKRPRIVPGRRISRSARLTASTAVPSATPGGRLKEIVTDGNCAWWLTASGAIDGA